MSVNWINPIIDRVLSDVLYAKNNADNIISLKGALNAEDLNRISVNLLWISENIQLSLKSYPDEIIPPEWEKGLFENPLSVFQNYEDNAYYLNDLYYLSGLFNDIDFGVHEIYGINTNARQNVDYNKINYWERILYYLYLLIYDKTLTWQDFYDTGETWQQDYDKNENWGQLLL